MILLLCSRGSIPIAALEKNKLKEHMKTPVKLPMTGTESHNSGTSCCKTYSEMPPVIGLDFGTTNSAIAVADARREATLASFADGTTTSFRSILYFPTRDKTST